MTFFLLTLNIHQNALTYLQWSASFLSEQFFLHKLKLALKMKKARWIILKIELPSLIRWKSLDPILANYRNRVSVILFRKELLLLTKNKHVTSFTDMHSLYRKKNCSSRFYASCFTEVKDLNFAWFLECTSEARVVVGGESCWKWSTWWCQHAARTVHTVKPVAQKNAVFALLSTPVFWCTAGPGLPCPRAHPFWGWKDGC